MTVIAIIGTGNMGAPMSINLAQAGFDVNAFDIVSEKMRPLNQYGIKTCTSHQEALENAEVVLTMLPTGAEVLQVYADEVFNHGSPAAILIDSSTIDLKDARKVHAQAAAMGFKMLDAPVSGGTVGAASGRLTFMVGGDAEVVASVDPVFEAMGAKNIHCGGPGMGQAAKMCNNMMLGIQMASVVEGFHLADSVGLSNDKLYEVALNSSGNCFSLTTFCPVPDLVPASPSNNGFKPGFSTDLMLKDMKIALKAAEAASLDLSVARLAASLYQTFSDEGSGDLDFSAIFKMSVGG